MTDHAEENLCNFSKLFSCT